MNMRSFKKYLTKIGTCAFIIACGQSGIAEPGTVGGGGGKSIVCRNPDKSIRSIQTLDLYEGVMDHKYKYPSVEGKDFRTIIFETIAKMEDQDLLNFYVESYDKWWNFGGDKKQAINTLKDEVHNILSALDNKESRSSVEFTNYKFLDGITLSPTQDSFEVFYPNNCSIEQLAVYKESLYVNYDLFKSMDDKNKAALILHESIYKLLRSQSYELNSIRTRRLISSLFENEKIVSMSEKLKGHRYIECETDHDEINKRWSTSTGDNQASKIYFLEAKIDNKEVIIIVPHVLNGVYLLDYTLNFWSFKGNLDKFDDSLQGFRSLRAGLSGIESGTKISMNFMPGRRIYLKVNSFVSAAAVFDETLVCSDKTSNPNLNVEKK
jgi:hypothetical protein